MLCSHINQFMDLRAIVGRHDSRTNNSGVGDTLGDMNDHRTLQDEESEVSTT